MEITPDTTQASKYFHTPGTKETGVIERSTNSFSLGEGGGHPQGTPYTPTETSTRLQGKSGTNHTSTWEPGIVP